MSRHDRASIVVPASPGAVFDVVTDIDRLPSWNDLITEVVVTPDALEPGAVWKVTLTQGPMRWVSRSTVIEHDPGRLRFVYRSQTDDDNPSFATWTWQVEPDPAGARLTVSWAVNPHTPLRRWVLAPFRARRLRAEVPRSLERLRGVMCTPRPPVPASGS